MTDRTNKEIAREFYDRFTTGDIAGAVDLMSDDARFWIPGKPELSRVAGWYTKDEAAALFLRMDRRLKRGLAMKVKSIIAEGDRLAVEVESRGELDNGRIYNNEYHVAMWVSDGKIREVREYQDTQHAHTVWLQP